MPIACVRSKPYHLETPKLKGNWFAPVRVSGLYSWRAFTANKTKGSKKKWTFIKSRNGDAQLFFCSETTSSTRGMIIRGPQNTAPQVGLLLEELHLHLDFDSKLTDNIWAYCIFSADWTCGTWELWQMIGKGCEMGGDGTLSACALLLGAVENLAQTPHVSATKAEVYLNHPLLGQVTSFKKRQLNVIQWNVWLSSFWTRCQPSLYLHISFSS